MRGHCSIGETGGEWKIMLPELGLKDYMVLAMSSHRGSRDPEYRVLSQFSSILINRIFLCFKENRTID